MKRFSKRYKKSQKLPTTYYHKPKIARHEIEEFGPGKKDIIFCPKGDAIYYYKSWHHNLEDYQFLKENKNLRFALCPFHQMEKNKTWEGEVRIINGNEEKLNQVLALAKNFAHRAYLKDPMHRILKIKKGKNTLSIFVSENQLAERMAKKINESFKNLFSKPKIHRGKGEDPFLIVLETLQKSKKVKPS